jgi:hypothetical protein
MCCAIATATADPLRDDKKKSNGKSVVAGELSSSTFAKARRMGHPSGCGPDEENRQLQQQIPFGDDNKKSNYKSGTSSGLDAGLNGWVAAVAVPHFA